MKVRLCYKRLKSGAVCAQIRQVLDAVCLLAPRGAINIEHQASSIYCFI